MSFVTDDVQCTSIAQAASDAVTTDSGVTYLVTDKGEMMAEDVDTDADVTLSTSAADDADINVSSVVILADDVIDVKMKSVFFSHFTLSVVTARRLLHRYQSER